MPLSPNIVGNNIEITNNNLLNFNKTEYQPRFSEQKTDYKQESLLEMTSNFPPPSFLSKSTGNNHQEKTIQLQVQEVSPVESIPLASDGSLNTHAEFDKCLQDVQLKLTTHQPFGKDIDDLLEMSMKSVKLREQGQEINLKEEEKRKENDLWDK